jgi:cell division protein FtsL
MKSFQKNTKLQQIMQSKPFLVFLGIIIIIFIFSTIGFMGRMEETINNRKMLQDKIAELEKSKNNLNSEISQLQTPQGIEENIREKFGLAKDGENMIMVVDDTSTTETNTQTNYEGFFSFLKNWFK